MARSRQAGAGTDVAPDAGFTMLEILIVLVIIAMAATLVAPAIESGMRAREVRSAVREVAGTMRAMQAEAIRTGKVQRRMVDPQGNALELEKGAAVRFGDTVQIMEIRGGDLSPNGGVGMSFFPNGSNSGIAMVVGERGMPAREGFVVRMDPILGLATIRDPGR